MDCRDYQKLISVGIDGGLDEKTDAAVREHVAQCETCAEFHATALSLQSALEASLEVPAPGDLTMRVKAAVARERDKASGTFHLPRWAQVPLMAGLVIVAVGLGGLVGRSLSDVILHDQAHNQIEALLPASDTSFAQALTEITSLETSE